MDNSGLSKDDIDYLFSNLEMLNQLAEQCINSTVADDVKCCTHLSDVQTATSDMATADASDRSMIESIDRRASSDDDSSIHSTPVTPVIYRTWQHV